MKHGLLVGLLGYAGAGKDEVGKVLVAAGFKRYAFADTLREMAYALNPIVDCEYHGKGDVRLADLVDDFGWDVVKQRSEVRELLQRLGTEAGRNVLGENIWVDTLMNRHVDKTLHAGDNVVITDVRFQNEIEAVKHHKGICVRVDRPGVGPRNDHISEIGWKSAKIDAVILNDGELAELRPKVHNSVAHFLFEQYN